MTIENLLKDSDFANYIETFYQKNIVNTDVLHALQSDPENYIRILNEIEPDDLKMMELFTFLKANTPSKSENLGLSKASVPEKPSNAKVWIIGIIVILISVIAFFVIKAVNGASSKDEDSGQVEVAIDDQERTPYFIVSASSSMTPSSGLSYSASNVLDNKLNTWWSPKSSKDAWIKIDLGEEFSVYGIQIHAGSHYKDYTTPNGDYLGNLYYQNYRINKIKVEFENGQSRILWLDDIDQIQDIILGGNFRTSWVKITPLDLYPTRRWKDICISELNILYSQ